MIIHRSALAGLLVLLLAACSTTPGETPTAPSSSASSTAASTSAASVTPEPSAPPAALPAPAFCSSETSTAALTACWNRMTPALTPVLESMVTGSGRTWRPVRTAVFATLPQKNPCESGGDGGQVGSFSCGKDRTVYLSTFEAAEPTRAYVKQARKVPGVLAADAQRVGVSLAVLQRGVPGQGQATILAHELTHQVLDQTGYQAWFDRGTEKYEPGSARYDAYGFAPETAADCLTGATLAEAKRRGLVRMNALDLWGSRAWLAQTDPFNPEKPIASPFRYRNEFKGEQYKGYGGAHWRLKAFDLGWKTPATEALRTCVDEAARWKGLTAQPKPLGG